MQLSSGFDVPTTGAKTWSILTDVSRVVNCLPGAQLISSEGDTHHGLMKVKVGPIRMQYEGTMRFVERDEEAARIVLLGEGRDGRGQGAANATITLDLDGDETATHVAVTTELQITGKVAQFGRNVLSDVSDNLVRQFAANLAEEVAGNRAPAGSEAVNPAPGKRATSAPERPDSGAEYLDLLPPSRLVGRVVPMTALSCLTAALGWWWGRRGRHTCERSLRSAKASTIAR